jgi:hypothetical protein
LSSLLDTVNQTEAFVKTLHNLRHWVSGVIDFHALAASLAARTLAHSKHSSIADWRLCLKDMNDQAKIEEWLGDVVKEAVPILLQEIAKLDAVADTKDAPSEEDENSKFGTLATANFGKIDRFYEGLDVIGMPQPGTLIAAAAVDIVFMMY